MVGPIEQAPALDFRAAAAARVAEEERAHAAPFPRDPTTTESGRATRFTNIPNTLEDDQLRCGTTFYSFLRNAVGGLTALSGLATYALTTLSQTTWVSAETAEWCIKAGVINMWVAPLLGVSSYGLHRLILKRKAQGEALAAEYNEARGFSSPDDDEVEV